MYIMVYHSVYHMSQPILFSTQHFSHQLISISLLPPSSLFFILVVLYSLLKNFQITTETSKVGK